METQRLSRETLITVQLPDNAGITNVEYVSSYNWIEADSPTIVVPGKPHLWTPPSHSKAVPKDSGHVYIAQNAARHPEFPLEPLFRSMYVTQPSFDINSVDVISDRNNIRKLLSFVDPSLASHGSESFTIKVEVVHDTMIFCRDEALTEEVIGRHDFRGYGRSFEKKYTKPELKDSTGHHRIISYDFCGFKYLIRHETDGYVKETTKPHLSANSSTQTGKSGLSDLLGSLSLSTEEARRYTRHGGSKLRIGEEGETVPLDSTLKIKTRTVNKPMSVKDVATQLWVSQTPKLVRAYHNRGRFQVPEVVDVTDEIKRWERVNEPTLHKLGALIKTIRAMVKAQGGKGTMRYDLLKDELFMDRGSGNLLPADLYSKWTEKSLATKSKVEVNQDDKVEKRQREAEAGEVKTDEEGDK